MLEPRRWTALVVDDEPAARDAVRGFLAEESRVEVVGEAGDAAAAVELVRRTEPDLLFLDVQMPGGDGFSVLETLGEDVPPGLVFVTAHDEHALRAFELHAMDYVLKPFGRPRFRKALDGVMRRLDAEDALSVRRTLDALLAGRRGAGDTAGVRVAADPAGRAEHRDGRPNRMGVRVGTRTVLVELEEVDWVEADGDHVRLHVGPRSHLVSERMHAMEGMLDPARFLRIHRSIIVNLRRVRELRRDPDGGGSVLLSDDVRLRVARTRWEELERALGLTPG